MTENIITALKELNMTTREAVHYGEGNYVVTVAYDTEAMGYKVFESRLREYGYTLSYDNEHCRNTRVQRKEIYDYVRCSSYEKGNVQCTLTHIFKTQTTYLCLCEALPVSEHLKRSYKVPEKRETKTTLHNVPLKSFGNSLLIQLKNGHFIISDGGLPGESTFLLPYMKNLIPEGEKPVIEAWFFSHLHVDHCGIIRDFLDGSWDPDSVIVDGFYYSLPGESVFELDMGPISDEENVRKAAKLLKTSKGTNPEVYRPRMGQRYYFDDISIDIVFTQEQLPPNCYCSTDFLKDTKRANFNDSSTWCMLNIEEQKVLFTGDADKGSMDHAMNMYDKDYFKLLAIDTAHHSWNPYMPFSKFVEAEVIIVTDKRLATPSFAPQTGNWYYPNVVLAEKAKDVLAFKEGAAIMEFPYKPGSFKRGIAR